MRACAIAHRNLISFFSSPNDIDELPEDEQEYPDQIFHYLLTIDSDNPKDYGYLLGNLMEVSLDAVELQGSKAFIALTAVGEVYIYSKHYKGIEGKLPDPTPPFIRPGTATRIRKIGEHLYAVSTSRVVHRRDNNGNWVFISQSAYGEDLKTSSGKVFGGFKDIDGFSETDIYAAGGDGHVWHFDGSVWRRIDIPTNVELCCLICASDGFVYIGGASYLMLRGRGDKWEFLNKPQDNLGSFKFIVEYQSKLYTVDYWGNTLYEVDAKGVRPTDMGGYQILPGGALCLAQGDGIMVIAGNQSAAMFDGKEWVSLFEPAGYRQNVEMLQLLQSTVEKAKKALTELDDDIA